MHWYWCSRAPLAVECLVVEISWLDVEAEVSVILPQASRELNPGSYDSENGPADTMQSLESIDLLRWVSLEIIIEAQVACTPASIHCVLGVLTHARETSRQVVNSENFHPRG